MKRPSSILDSPFSIRSFTLIELLAVMGIIVLLAGMIIGTATYANRKSLESKTKSQLHQITLALELYKTDIGYYPVSPYDWPKLYSISHWTNPVNSSVGSDGVGMNLSWMSSNSWAFYRALLNYAITNKPPNIPELDRKNYYLEVKPDQFQPLGTTNYLVDPYGNVWGYFNAPDTSSRADQFNSRSYDLWSYGLSITDPTNSLIANWRKQ